MVVEIKRNRFGSAGFFGKKHSKETKRKISEHFNNKPKKKFRIDSLGYIMIFKPEHPYATKSKCVYEHRLVMERYLGRYLLPTECVHHKDGNIQNNCIENLSLFDSVSEHTKFHRNIE